jgi:8-oxo-dGTP diphosphatase
LIRVVAALIERKGRLLICQRRRGGLFGLKWEFPGGKLRPSETPRAGLLRELREELGSTARIGRPVYRARHRYRELGEGVEITFFSVCQIVPAPRNLAFERMVWARPADLARYDFLSADGALVRRLARGELLGRIRKGSSGRRPRPGLAR